MSSSCDKPHGSGFSKVIFLNNNNNVPDMPLALRRASVEPFYCTYVVGDGEFVSGLIIGGKGDFISESSSYWNE